MTAKRTTAREWMPLLIDRWCESDNVAAMSPECEALYMRLLLLHWRKGSLPKDLDVLAEMLPLKFGRLLKRHWPKISPCFVEVDGRLVNQTNAEEIEKWEAIVEARRIAGRNGGRASAQARVEQTSTVAEANVNPLPIRSDPIRNEEEPSPSLRSGPVLAPPGLAAEPPPVESASPGPANPAGLDSDSDSDATAPPGEHAPPAKRPGGNAITRAWEADWLASRGVPYPTTAADAMALANAKKRLGGDFGKLREAWSRMLASTDAFDAKNASVEWFCKRLPGFMVEARVLTKAQRGDLEVLEACRQAGVA